MELKKICVFCGSSSGRRLEYTKAAQAMGMELARRELTLVYGGGSTGLMGTVADSALKMGGRVIGVIPRGLATKELAHPGLTEMRVVETMHERKALMAELSDASIALPGGFGTFEEFFEILTWSQLGYHRKPCAILNIEKYFDPVRDLLDHAVTEEFVRHDHRTLVIEETDPARLLDAIETWEAPNLKRWINAEQT